jgi:hypothetical protein
MKTLLTLLMVPLFIANCSMSRQVAQNETAYHFDYEGATYTIGLKPNIQGDGNPYNLLVCEQLGVRAIDHDLDSTIDTVISGTLSQTDAQRIYKFGIKQAEHSGKWQQADWAWVPENGGN